MLLQLSTWQEVEAYLERSTGIVIPMGSTEQHGPNGLIGTDAICPQAIAHRMAAQARILVGPTVSLGAAQFNLGFPGTVSVRASTFMAVITDYVDSLARQGFDRFYFLNGHGGNAAPARAAFQDIYAAPMPPALAARDNQSGVRCRLRSWWEYPAADALRHELYGDWEGLHATPSEVAITQHEHPEAIHQVAMSKPPKLSKTFLRNHAGDGHYDAVDHRRRFPDGRIGSDPSMATPEHGGRLLAAAVPDAIADYEAFLAEE